MTKKLIQRTYKEAMSLVLSTHNKYRCLLVSSNEISKSLLAVAIWAQKNQFTCTRNVKQENTTDHHSDTYNKLKKTSQMNLGNQLICHPCINTVYCSCKDANCNTDAWQLSKKLRKQHQCLSLNHQSTYIQSCRRHKYRTSECPSTVSTIDALRNVWSHLHRGNGLLIQDWTLQVTPQQKGMYDYNSDFSFINDQKYRNSHIPHIYWLITFYTACKSMQMKLQSTAYLLVTFQSIIHYKVENLISRCLYNTNCFCHRQLHSFATKAVTKKIYK
jgi:hypothetical protein